VDGAAAGCPAWPLPRCPHTPAAVAGVRSAGACGLPVSGRPRPVSRHPDSGSPLAASTWQLDQHRRANPTCAVQPWRRNGGWGSAAVLPQPGHCSRCLGGCGTGHRGRLGCPLLFPEPRSVSTRSVSGRLVSAADTAGAGGCPPLQEQVACPASAGRVPPPPVRLGELAVEPVAKLGADQGHGRSLHRQGFLGGQPAQPQA
jgi:hypothetical protein